MSSKITTCSTRQSETRRENYLNAELPSLPSSLPPAPALFLPFFLHALIFVLIAVREIGITWEKGNRLTLCCYPVLFQITKLRKFVINEVALNNDGLSCLLPLELQISVWMLNIFLLSIFWGIFGKKLNGLKYNLILTSCSLVKLPLLVTCQSIIMLWSQGLPSTHHYIMNLTIFFALLI